MRAQRRREGGSEAFPNHIGRGLIGKQLNQPLVVHRREQTEIDLKGREQISGNLNRFKSGDRDQILVNLYRVDHL